VCAQRGTPGQKVQAQLCWALDFAGSRKFQVPIVT
jgi:hypothetical protein